MDEAIEIRLKGQEKRIEKVEAEIVELRKIHLSVQELALNMQHMLEEQKEQGRRLEKLENKPADNWNKTQSTVLTTIVQAVTSALVVGLVLLVAQNI